MNTKSGRNRSKRNNGHQELRKFEEEQEMKTAKLTTKLNMWLREHLATRTPAKLLGGLAMGALLTTATVMPLATTYADEPVRSLSSQQVVECYPEAGFCSNDLEALDVAGNRQRDSHSLPVDHSLVDWEEMTSADDVAGSLLTTDDAAQPDTEYYLDPDWRG